MLVIIITLRSTCEPVELLLNSWNSVRNSNY